MKRRIITVLLALALMIVFASAEISAETDPLESKSTYYTEESDYIPGDCILTATKMMIKRSAIMHGKTGWSEITNEMLRPAATVDGCLQSSFTFESEGLTYEIGYGEFCGEDNESRIREIAALLKEHPEGIVVHGDWAATSGTHGCLAVKVEDGQLYAADAACNTGMFSEGIQKWEDTSMLDPVMVTRYWYIKSVRKSGPAPKAETVREMYFNMLRCA